MAKILSVDDASVTLDFNHPLAGRNLTFEVELVSINQEEIQMVEKKSWIAPLLTNR